MPACSACPQVRALFHAFMEAFFELPCSCEAAEERRRAQPTRDPAPLVRRAGGLRCSARRSKSMGCGMSPAPERLGNLRTRHGPSGA